MENTNDILMFKKVALRFLKETGTYNAFIDYLKTGQVAYNKNDWYKTAYIDNIFGRVNFTGYLTKEKNIHTIFNVPLKCTYITTIFRTYLKIKYNDKFTLKYPKKIIEDSSDYKKLYDAIFL